MCKPDQQNSQQKNSFQEPLSELPPAIKRRRKNRRLYKYKSKSAAYDKMIVAVALLVAVFMVMTKGCSGPVGNLVKFFDQQGKDSPDSPLSQPTGKENINEGTANQ